LPVRLTPASQTMGLLRQAARRRLVHAATFGNLKARMAGAGTMLDDFDLIIASTALAANLTLVSNNERHFKRVEGLRLVN
jgi:predicted nucleic acid-binding protein